MSSTLFEVAESPDKRTTNGEAEDGQEQALPSPPWQRVPERSSRRRRDPLTREAIVATALRVLDRDGLGGFSMRRVAEELDTGAASLYWHVGSKDGLLDLVFEEVIGEQVDEVPDPDPEQWQEQFKEVARVIRRTIRRRRASAGKCRFTQGSVCRFSTSIVAAGTASSCASSRQREAFA